LHEQATHPDSPRFVGVKEQQRGDAPMNAIIYLVGLVVVVMFILSLIGLR
jgi:hypothetical protein